MLPDVSGWSADEMEAILTDVSVWEKPVRKIAEREGVCIEQLVPGFPASSAVFTLNRTYVLKIFTPLFYPERHVESELLRALESIEEVPSPRVRSEGVLSDKIEWPYLILDHIPGIALRELLPTMSPEVLTDVAAQLGLVVRAIHTTDTTPFETIRSAQRDGASLLSELRLGAKEAMQRLVALDKGARACLSSRAFAELESLFVSTHLFEPDQPLALVNGDLTEDHLFLIQAEGRWSISGLIDFADACVGPRELDWHDLRFCMFDGNTQAMRAFWHAYDSQLVIDDAYCRKCMLYSLANGHWFEMIQPTLRECGRSRLNSLEELQEELWPRGLWS